MYEKLSNHDFVKRFDDYSRSENFSYEGRLALFEYLEECGESSLGIELDVVTICCEYTEDTLGNLLIQYDFIESLEHLEDHTMVIPVPDNGTYIIQNF